MEWPLLVVSNPSFVGIHSHSTAVVVVVVVVALSSFLNVVVDRTTRNRIFQPANLDCPLFRSIVSSVRSLSLFLLSSLEKE